MMPNTHGDQITLLTEAHKAILEFWRNELKNETPGTNVCSDMEVIEYAVLSDLTHEHCNPLNIPLPEFNNIFNCYRSAAWHSYGIEPETGVEDLITIMSEQGVDLLAESALVHTVWTGCGYTNVNKNAGVRSILKRQLDATGHVSIISDSQIDEVKQRIRDKFKPLGASESTIKNMFEYPHINMMMDAYPTRYWIVILNSMTYDDLALILIRSPDAKKVVDAFMFGSLSECWILYLDAVKHESAIEFPQLHEDCYPSVKVNPGWYANRLLTEIGYEAAALFSSVNFRTSMIIAADEDARTDGNAVANENMLSYPFKKFNALKEQFEIKHP